MDYKATVSSVVDVGLSDHHCVFNVKDFIQQDVPERQEMFSCFLMWLLIFSEILSDAPEAV